MLSWSMAIGNGPVRNISVVNGVSIGDDAVSVRVGEVGDGEDEHEGQQCAHGAHGEEGQHEPAGFVEGGSDGRTCKNFECTFHH